MPDPAAPPPGMVFLRDLPCIHCGYNLRTLPLSAPCPECGKPSADSLDSLRAAAPQDLARIRFGILLMAVAALAIPLLSLTISFVSILSLRTRMGGTAEKFSALAAMSGLGLVGPGLAAWGAWLLSARIQPSHPSGSPPPFEITPLTRNLRFAAVAYAGFSTAAYSLYALILYFVFASFSGAGGSRGIADDAAFIMPCLILLTMASWTARNALVSLRMTWICKRNGSKRLERLFGVMRWISVAACILTIAAGVLTLLAFMFSKVLERLLSGPSGLDSILEIIATVISGLGSIAAIGWLVLWPVTLIVMYATLGRASTAAVLNVDGLLGPAPSADPHLHPPLAPPTASPPAPSHLQKPHSPSPGEIGAER